MDVREAYRIVSSRWAIVVAVIASPLLLYLLQLPKQRSLALQHVEPSLAERLAAEYPEEVLAAAFARVNPKAASERARARLPVPDEAPRALNVDAPLLVGEPLTSDVVERPVVPEPSQRGSLEPERAVKKKKKKKKKKSKNKKRRDVGDDHDEGSS